MPKIGRQMNTFGDQMHMKRITTMLLVVAGLGGATVLTAPMNPNTTVAIQKLPPHNAAAPVPDGRLTWTPPPVVVSKDSSAEDIVKAIVGHGQAAGLSEDQIKTVIATAKIESDFRPAVSGGVQAYGGRGTSADEVIGLFQEKASFGTVAERQDPNLAITRFIARFLEAYPKHGIAGDSVQAATLAQNPQLLKRNGGVGTHYYRTIQAAMGAAGDLYSQAVAATQPPVI